MLARDGRSKTLDADAQGYVRAEAVGCAILTSARAAQGADPSVRYWCALLAGSAVNQDGRSSSLTGDGQLSLYVILVLCFSL